MVSFLEEAEEDVPPPGGRVVKKTAAGADDEDWVETHSGRGASCRFSHAVALVR